MAEIGATKLIKGKIMDANTYYLNQHLDDVDRRTKNHELAVDYAQQMMMPGQDHDPWEVQNFLEAMGDMSVETAQLLINDRMSDKEIARIIREQVVSYWFNVGYETYE